MNLYESALAAFRSGATDEAASLAEELVDTSRASADLPGKIDGLCMLGRVALRRDELRRVAELAEEARDLARGSKEPRLERMPLHLQAVAARMQGDFESARQFYRESIDLNRQLGEERMVAADIAILPMSSCTTAMPRKRASSSRLAPIWRVHPDTTR